MKSIERQIEVKKLKAELKDLCKSIGISKRRLMKKLPRIYGSGNKIYDKPSNENYILYRNWKGRKMSLRQKVEYLRIAASLTQEFHESMKEELDKVREQQKLSGSSNDI